MERRIFHLSQKTKKPFKASRLQFTEEERAAPTLEKPIAKSEKAADKLEKAQTKIPQKTVKIKERTFDAQTGKTKVRLHFEEVDKPKPSSKLTHGIKKLRKEPPYLLCIRKSVKMSRIMWGLKPHTAPKRQAIYRSPCPKCLPFPQAKALPQLGKG